MATEKEIRDEIREAVKEGIDAKIKKFKKIMGPNTRKLINANDKNVFTKAFKEKNWLGTTPAHAAAIVARGAVVVPKNPEDKTIGLPDMIQNIKTLKTATKYDDIKNIVKNFGSKHEKLQKIIETNETDFFKIIRAIFRRVSTALLNPESNDKGSGDSSKQNNNTVPEDTTHLSTILANITHECDTALKTQQLDAKTLINSLKTLAGINENDTYAQTDPHPNFKTYLIRSLNAYTKQYEIGHHITFAHMSRAASDKETKKTAKSKITKIFNKIQTTLDELYSLKQQQLTTSTTNNSDAPTDSQKPATPKTETNDVDAQKPSRSPDLDAQTHQLANSKKHQNDALEQLLENNTKSTTNTSAPSATPQSRAKPTSTEPGSQHQNSTDNTATSPTELAAPKTSEPDALTDSAKRVIDTLSKYKGTKLSASQEKEFIKDLEGLKDIAPKTAEYLLMYLEKESGRKVFAENDNPDLDNTQDAAIKELADSLNLSEPANIVNDFENVIDITYRPPKRRNIRSSMQRQAELDASNN